MLPQTSPTTQFGGYDGPLNDQILARFSELKSAEDWQNFVKAVQTAGSQNVLDAKAGLTGIPAIRMESLDGTLRATVAQEENLTLFKRLKISNTKSSIFEFATKTNHGGAIGNSFHGEADDIRSAVANYDRQLIKVKYLMERAEISVVAELQGVVGEDAKAQENASATMRLLMTNELALFHGDSTINLLEYDGIEAILRQKFGGKYIYDLDGSSDTEVLFQQYYQAAQDVTGPGGGWGGRITDAYFPPVIQTDLDLYLAPQWRVPLDASGPKSVDYGAPVAGIKTSFGKPIALNHSWFIKHGENPYIAAPLSVKVGDGPLPETAAAAPTLAAAPVTAATVTGASQVSKFTGTRNGTYYYGVSTITDKGEGLLSAIQSATVAVGGAIDLTITPAGGVNPVGYVLYRSKQSPATAPTAADLREFKRIQANGTNPVVYRDLNADLPGAASTYLLDLRPEAVDFVELLSLTTFPLYPTTKPTRPWALLYFGALRLGYAKRHRVIKNYVPKSAIWKPHN